MMLDFLKLLGLLYNAHEIINGRLHFKITIDIQDMDGNTLAFVAPPTDTGV